MKSRIAVCFPIHQEEVDLPPHENSNTLRSELAARPEDGLDSTPARERDFKLGFGRSALNLFYYLAIRSA